MNTRFSFLSLLILFIVSCGKKSGYPVVTTFAGTGVMGAIDGKSTEASFSNLLGITADTAGNIYVADSHNNLIRKITPNGMVTTFAGNGTQGSADGKGTAASFFNPAGLAADKNGNIYVADTHNSLIRKISPDGMVTTIAGRKTANLGNQADSFVKLDNPAGVAVDTAGNVYVTDWNNDLIRKISPGGQVTNFAGNGAPGSTDGIATAASFYLPWGITVDAGGNVFVADSYNNMIRKINPKGIVTTIAGKKAKGAANGKGAAASFLHPAGISLDKEGNLLVADVGNNKIRKISPDGMVTTFAGSGVRGSANGRDTAASFYKPYGVAVDKNGIVYVADYQNNLVRKISF